MEIDRNGAPKAKTNWQLADRAPPIKLYLRSALIGARFPAISHWPGRKSPATLTARCTRLYIFDPISGRRRLFIRLPATDSLAKRPIDAIRLVVVQFSSGRSSL